MHDSIVECIADSTEKWEKTLFFGGGFSQVWMSVTQEVLKIL